MTTKDADQMKEWIDGLTTEQIGLLWRWIFRLYFYRLHCDTMQFLYGDSWRDRPIKQGR